MENNTEVQEVDDKNSLIKQTKIIKDPKLNEIEKLSALPDEEISKLEGINNNFRFATLQSSSSLKEKNSTKFDPYSLAKDAVSNVANLINDKELSKDFYEREYQRALNQFDPRSSNYVPSYLRNLGRNFPFQHSTNQALKDWADWNKRRFGDPYYRPWDKKRYDAFDPFFNPNNYNNAFGKPILNDDDILKEDKDQKDNDNFQVRGTGYDANPRVPDASGFNSFGAELTNAKPFLNPIPPDPEDEEEQMKLRLAHPRLFSTEEALKLLKKIRETNDFQRLKDIATMTKKLGKGLNFFKNGLSPFEGDLSPELLGSSLNKLNKLNLKLDNAIKTLENFANKRLGDTANLLNNWKKKLAVKTANMNIGLSKNLFKIPGISPGNVLKNLFNIGVDSKLTSDNKDCNKNPSAAFDLYVRQFYSNYSI
jgi:hypothetical protein